MGCPVSVTLTFALFTIQVDFQTLTTSEMPHSRYRFDRPHLQGIWCVSSSGEHVVMCQSCTDTLKDLDLYSFGNRHS